MEPIPDLNDMHLFAKVVDHGGYSAAARALGLQTSRLSRCVSGLEAHLGVRLLQRTTRRIALTEVGQTFYQHCVTIVGEAQAAQESVDQTRSTPQGLVRISCPPGLLHSGVSLLLSRYLRDHPGVRIHLESTNRRIDVVDEGFDIAVRVRMPPLEDSDLAIRVLGGMKMVLVGSPWLFAQHRVPRKPEDLRGLPTLSLTRPGERYAWRFGGAASGNGNGRGDSHDRPGGSGVDSDANAEPPGEPLVIQHQPRLATDDLGALRQAALDGIGIVFLPRALVQADVDAGRLKPVLPALAPPDAIAHLVFPSRRGMAPAVRGLIDALAASYPEMGFD